MHSTWHRANSWHCFANCEKHLNFHYSSDHSGPHRWIFPNTEIQNLGTRTWILGCRNSAFLPRRIFERLYLVLGLVRICALCHLSVCSHTPAVLHITISRFLSKKILKNFHKNRDFVITIQQVIWGVLVPSPDLMKTGPERCSNLVENVLIQGQFRKIFPFREIPVQQKRRG